MAAGRLLHVEPMPSPWVGAVRLLPEVLWCAHHVWNADENKFPPKYPTLAHSLQMLNIYSEKLKTSMFLHEAGQLLMQLAPQPPRPLQQPEPLQLHELPPASILEHHRGLVQGVLVAAQDAEEQDQLMLGFFRAEEEKVPEGLRFPFPENRGLPLDFSCDVRVGGQSALPSALRLTLYHHRLLLDELLTLVQGHVPLRDVEAVFWRARLRAHTAVQLWWEYDEPPWPRVSDHLQPSLLFEEYDLRSEPNGMLVMELCADEPPRRPGLQGGAEDDPADLQLLTEDVKMPEDDGAAMRTVRGFEPRGELGNVLASSSSSSSVFSRSSVPASQEPQPPLAASTSTSPSMPLPSSGWPPSRASPGHPPSGLRPAGEVKPQPANTTTAAQLQAYLQHREARGDITYSRAYYGRAILLRRLCKTTNALHHTVEQDIDLALEMRPPPPRAQEVKDYIELLKRQQQEEEEEERREREQRISQGTTAEVNEDVSSEDDGDSDDEPDDSSEDEDAPCEPVDELKEFIEAAVQSALPNQVSDLLRFLLDDVGVRCMDDLAVLTWRARPETPMLYALTDPETRQLLLPAQQSLSGGFMHSVIAIIDPRNKQEAARRVYLHPWHRQLLSSAALTPADDRFITQLLQELYGCLVEAKKPAAHRQLATRWLMDAKLQETKVGVEEATEEDEDNSWLTQLIAVANTSVTPVTPLISQPPIVLPPDEPSRAEIALHKLISDFPRFKRYTALSQRRLLVMVMELLYVYSSLYLRQRQDPHEALTALAPVQVSAAAANSAASTAVFAVHALSSPLASALPVPVASVPSRPPSHPTSSMSSSRAVDLPTSASKFASPPLYAGYQPIFAPPPPYDQMTAAYPEADGGLPHHSVDMEMTSYHRFSSSSTSFASGDQWPSVSKDVQPRSPLSPPAISAESLEAYLVLQRGELSRIRALQRLDLDHENKMERKQLQLREMELKADIRKDEELKVEIGRDEERRDAATANKHSLDIVTITAHRKTQGGTAVTTSTSQQATQQASPQVLTQPVAFYGGYRTPFYRRCWFWTVCIGVFVGLPIIIGASVAAS